MRLAVTLAPPLRWKLVSAIGLDKLAASHQNDLPINPIVTENHINLNTVVRSLAMLLVFCWLPTGLAQVLHHIAAANIVVIQNDENNTTASVTVSTSLSINDFRIRSGSNRGDYNVQIGNSST